MRIDEALSGPLRTLRTRPRSLLLGPSGRRLAADVLDDAPGFRGAFDYVHKTNIPLLFSVGVEPKTPGGAAAEQQPERSEGVWRPSHLTTRSRIGAVVVEETRFVTWTDEAVSLQRWSNTSTEPLVLRGVYDRSWCERSGQDVTGRRRVEAHAFTLTATISAFPRELWDGIELAPGETKDVRVVAALRHLSDSAQDPVIEQSTTWSPDSPVLLERQRAEYQEWFDDVPELESDSVLLERAWAYRWYILRNTQAEPAMGRLRGPVMYEGRSHKLPKTPWQVTGWDFNKLIPLSTPFHILDLRWRTSPGLGSAVIDSIRSVQGADGQLYASTVRGATKPYASFFGHAVAQFARVHGRRSVSDASVQAARRQVLGEREALEAGADELPVQRDHKLTGKEYQPSYWAFHDFPEDPADPASITPLKRVDRAIYQYLNAAGVLELDAAVDGFDERLSSIRDTIASAVRTKMWDRRDGFFFDLRADDDAVARVRNVVGFYPWWAGLAGGEHAEALRAALLSERFGTHLPYPSAAADEPAFRPQGGWMGHFLKGRNGCMWNGPAWPYTTGIVLDAIAESATPADTEDLTAEFRRGLGAYLRSHFRDGDASTPYLVEHYDPLTGEALSDEPDYSHSSLIDLIVRRVVGLVPLERSWELRPLDIGAQHVRLRGVVAGAHRIDIELRREAGRVRARVICACGVLWDAGLPRGGTVLAALSEPCSAALL